MPWIKQGVVFSLKDAPNRSNHVQVPTPFVMDDRVRVYYSSRNNGKAFIAYFDLDINDLTKVIGESQWHVMMLGQAGAFDCDGVMPSCVIRNPANANELFMYYVGWSELAGDARYQNEIGLATSHDNGESFQRKFEGPILGRSTTEPGMAIMPAVMYNGWFRMWYSSGTEWRRVGDKYEPVYVIKYADSLDGVSWNRFGFNCVIPNSPEEALCRPAVIFEDGKYKMWFSARNSAFYRGGLGSYHMGYAESDDEMDFVRNDDASGISYGAEGEFDSNMICYPAICDVKGQRVMLHNGNGFGQTGIGLAVWK